MTDEEIDAKLDAESLVAQTFDHATLSRRAPLDQVQPVVTLQDPNRTSYNGIPSECMFILCSS